MRKRAKLVGISYGDVAAMKRFVSELGLHFDMLSDSDKKVARLYGAYGYISPARVTFIVDATGVIRAVIDNVSASSHAEQVLKALDAAGL